MRDLHVYGDPGASRTVPEGWPPGASLCLDSAGLSCGVALPASWEPSAARAWAESSGVLRRGLPFNTASPWDADEAAG